MLVKVEISGIGAADVWQSWHPYIVLGTGKEPRRRTVTTAALKTGYSSSFSMEGDDSVKLKCRLNRFQHQE